jgi:hypothetical protein
MSVVSAVWYFSTALACDRRCVPNQSLFSTPWLYTLHFVQLAESQLFGGLVRVAGGSSERTLPGALVDKGY